MADTLFTFEDEQALNDGPVTCLGINFENDAKRREFFREELRKKLPELRLIEGFPVGTDDDIIALSDPPYYTACPNPWVKDFIKEWESEKAVFLQEGKRHTHFEVNEPYASDVSEGRSNPIYNAHSYHTKVPHPAIMRYLLHYTQPGDIVYDGFAGTGMTGVAARMCSSPDIETRRQIEEDFRHFGYKKPVWGKRHAICSDLSPLASFIAYNYNVEINTSAFRKECERILDVVESKSDWMYKTQHNVGKTLGDVKYYVYSDVLICPNCGKEFVFWDEAVDKKSGEVMDEFSCPHCSALVTKKKCEHAIETTYDPFLKSSVSQYKKDIILVVYDTPDGKRYEKKPDAFDYDLLEKIKNANSELVGVPYTRMPEGGETRRNDKEGITHVHQFFTERNLFAAATFLAECKESRYYLLLTGVMSDISKMARFKIGNYFRGGGGPFISGLSGTLYIPGLSVEKKVSFAMRNRLDTLCRALDFMKGTDSNTVSVNSATNSIVPDNSIDYIFTDPPFGANIMYAELNYIQESWIKVITNDKSEAIINREQNKTLPSYQSLMTNSLKDYYRVLKPGKWITIEFSNTSANVWNSIQYSLQAAGFVVASVAALDKKMGSFKAVTTPTAVKQDLVITCFKPTEKLISAFKQSLNEDKNVWNFIDELLLHLPVHLKKENATAAVVERTPKILFDRLIAYYVQHGYQVPIDAVDFQKGLRERFVERDGMFFTAEQAIEYEEKKKETTSFVSLALLVGSEAEGIEWLKHKLEDGPKTYSEILPDWMQDLVRPKKGDTLPELMQILDENFLKDEKGYWHIPDLNDQAQLDAVKTRRLLKEFEVYVEAKKVKNARLEALRAGFKECYKNKDFATIVAVGDKIDEELLTTDEVLLRFYDIASSRV